MNPLSAEENQKALLLLEHHLNNIQAYTPPNRGMPKTTTSSGTR